MTIECLSIKRNKKRDKKDAEKIENDVLEKIAAALIFVAKEIFQKETENKNYEKKPVK